jgi:hypothetical protein
MEESNTATSGTITNKEKEKTNKHRNKKITRITVLRETLTVPQLAEKSYAFYKT